MENLINVGTFIQHLTYYVKMTIYINKGTTEEALLERCIKIYKKYKSIEAEKEMTPDNETFVRKCYKRLNLILKVDAEGRPVDIRNKENQLKMLSFEPHPSLPSNDLELMTEYLTEHKVDILTQIPLSFVLRESKYKNLLWQYTRSLFYLSQILIDSKKKIAADAMKELESILESIAQLEDEIKINKLMALDKFLNMKLIKTGINESNLNDAKSEVKDLLKKKGVSDDKSVNKMVDCITEKLAGTDLSSGNLFAKVIGIARQVTDEMKDDLQGRPDMLQTIFYTITDLLKDLMNESSDKGEEIPSNFKNIFDKVLSNKNILDPNNNNVDEAEVINNLEKFVMAQDMTEQMPHKRIGPN